MFTRYRSQLKKMYNILLNSFSFSSVVTILKKEKTTGTSLEQNKITI